MKARKLKLNTSAIKLGCSSRCRKLNLTDLFSPKPKQTTSTNKPAAAKSSELIRLQDGRSYSDWMAVEKVSENPFLDFRDSMLQMVLEKEMYGEDELREMLRCFLKLNSEDYHEVIFKAFVEVLEWCVYLVCRSDQNDQNGSDSVAGYKV
ncbi:hypothetical protein QQ045_028924 [Rhodiola kirilowii]